MPPFCSWATVVCDFITWFKRDDSNKDTDVDIQTPDVKPTSTDIRFSGSCPANVQIPFTFAGNTTTVTVMDWASFCDMIATYLKPLVIALASFAAARILGGVNVND